MQEYENDEIDTLGWDAIDEELEKIYSNQEPKHYAPILSYALGGSDPLDGISIYDRDEPVPHWHYITYGFSELYEKKSENLEYSGFGFELTFRLKKEARENTPPVWPVNFLQNLAGYIFSTGNYFESGHYVDTNGPIALESDTLLKAISFIHDPELSIIHTPNGKVEFLQVVGITIDELDAIKCWKSYEVMKLFSKYMPLWITDLNRDSLLKIEDITKAIDKQKQ